MTANTYSGSIATLPELVDVVNRTFVPYQEGYKGVFMSAPFVIKDGKARNSGNSTLYAEPIITERYAKMRPDAVSAQISPYQYGYEKALVVNSYTHVEAVSYGIHEFGRRDGMMNQMKMLVQAPTNKLELDLAARYAFAWDESYTDSIGATIDTSMGDGLAKISTVHTVTGSTRTFSNQVPANPAFSKASLVSAKKVGQRGTIDNLGVNTAFNADYIITTDDEDTVLAVKELLNATANIESPNANTYNNYTNATLKHIASPLICSDVLGQRVTAKEKYWFIVDSSLATLYLTIINPAYNRLPTLGGNGDDLLSGTWTFLSGIDYGICEVSGRGTVGSKGTGV